MTYKMRNYSFDEDLEKARKFQFDIFKQTSEHYTWVPTRLENERHGPCGDEEPREDDSKLRIWEYSDGDETSIVAVSILEPNGVFWINVHPDHEDLIRKLIPAVEEQRKNSWKGEEAELKIGTPVPVGFKRRIDSLREFGYEDGGLCEHNRIIRLDHSTSRLQTFNLQKDTLLDMSSCLRTLNRTAMLSIQYSHVVA